MGDEELVTSPLKRMAKIGGLVGRIGVSMAGEKAMSVFRSDMSQQVCKLKNMKENAERIFKTLGQLKGGAMKAGQMLSLYQGLLPPEVTRILSKLQKEAPSVPFEVMEEEVKVSLKKDFSIFKYIEPVPYAAASIGQVHKAELQDGRKVALKIQYPAIDHIIKSDLKNMKVLLGAMFSLVSNIDFEPVWEELKARLIEELDYEREARQLKRMVALHKDYPEIVIPQVIDDASRRNVLTMELVEGIAPSQACTTKYSQELRNTWGRVLYESALRGIFEVGLLHADPNFANFAFLADGRVIVYDFGCMKEVPPLLSIGYAKLVEAALAEQKEKIPEILKEMGIHKKDGSLLRQEMIDSYVDFFGIILRKSPPYQFGEDDDFYENLFKLVRSNWDETADIQFPKDVVYVDRTMSGHFGNLSKLKAYAPWRDIIGGYAQKRLAQESEI